MLTVTNAAKSYLHTRAANHGESYIWLGVNSVRCVDHLIVLRGQVYGQGILF